MNKARSTELADAGLSTVSANNSVAIPSYANSWLTSQPLESTSF